MNHPGRQLALQSIGWTLIVAVAALALPVPAVAQFIDVGVFTPGGGPPHPYFEFTVPAPPGTPATIDFSGCQKFWLSANQPMPAGMPPQVVDCTGHTVSTVADAGGVARFRIVGSSANPSGGAVPGSEDACAVITLGGAPATLAGAPAGVLFVATFDEDNLLGGSVADLAALISDVLLVETTPGHLYLPRSDFEHDGDVDAADIGKWLEIYLGILVPAHANGPSCGDPGFNCCSLIP